MIIAWNFSTSNLNGDISVNESTLINARRGTIFIHFSPILSILL